MKQELPYVDSFIDREYFQPEPLLFHAEPSLQDDRRSTFFGKMCFLSMTLHAVTVAFFVLSPGGRVSIPSVTYVDLTVPSPITAQAPAPAAPPAEAAAAPEEESPEQGEAPPVPPPSPPAAPAVNPETSSLSLGLAQGYFNSISDGATLRDDVRDYYFAMLKKINETWWASGSAGKEGMKRDVLVNMVISREGEILSKKIVESSGNQWYDSLVLQTLQKAAPLPALPASYSGDFFQAPVRVVRPLSLSLGKLF